MAVRTPTADHCAAAVAVGEGQQPEVVWQRGHGGRLRYALPSPVAGWAAAVSGIHVHAHRLRYCPPRAGRERT